METITTGLDGVCRVDEQDVAILERIVEKIRADVLSLVLDQLDLVVVFEKSAWEGLHADERPGAVLRSGLDTETVEVPGGITSGSIVVDITGEPPFDVGEFAAEGLSVSPAVREVDYGETIDFMPRPRAD